MNKNGAAHPYSPLRPSGLYSNAHEKAPSKSTPARTPRAAADAALEDQLPDFSDLIENAVAGILVHRNFKPLYANKAFAHLFGYKSPQGYSGHAAVAPPGAATMYGRAPSRITTI